MSNSNSAFVNSLVGQSPMLLFYIVGIVLALATWGRHPMVSLLTLIGMLICLFDSLVFTAVWNSVTTSAIRSHRSAAQMRQIYTSLNLLRSLIYAVGSALVLAAVFVGRGQYRAGFETDAFQRGASPSAPPPFARRPGDR